MKLKSAIKQSLAKKILIYMILLMLISSFIISVVTYDSAKKELDEKGKIILKNAATSAKAVIDSYDETIRMGIITREEAEEDIKRKLMGHLQADGSRKIEADMDLGENGYLLIYNSEGLEIMHPRLEGLNMWDVVDPINQDYYIVREQIKAAKAGGGFVYYNWEYPESDKIGKKVTYNLYDENWDWVIAAGSYIDDFDDGANIIIRYILVITVVVMLLGGLMSYWFINQMVSPIHKVVMAMKKVGRGDFEPINEMPSEDETGVLIRGFNQMVASIKTANEELVNQANRITYLAYNDVLSGLPNRNRFRTHVNNQIELGCEQAYFVLLDIKDFKMINSIVGTQMGDQIIAAVGTAFNAHADTCEMIARSSGNEFVIWIERDSIKALEERLNLFEKQFKEQLLSLKIYQRIKFHMAVVKYPTQGADFNQLISRVSIAMKYAKEDSYQRTIYFEEYMESAIENNVVMKEELESALKEDQFKIAYQEKVSTQTNRVEGVEALSRWHSDIFGTVSPVVFIPAINQSQLTVKFGYYVVKKALNDYPKLVQKYGEHVTISINISPILFLEEHFLIEMKQFMNQYQIPRERLILEITEDIFINDFDLVQNRIESLKGMGILIALDDFGTGYSSLNYLTNMSINELKIDKTFIDRILTDEKTWILFETLTKMAKAYNYKVVAEGVETNDQLVKVKEAGIDMVQGYIFSKPSFLNEEEL